MNQRVKTIYDFVFAQEDKYYSMLTGGKNVQADILNTYRATSFQLVRCFIEEMERAISALDKENGTVDYVISHCAPRSIQRMIADWYENDSLTSFLEIVRTDLSFKHWYFGHYHIDKQINEKFTALYQNIVCLERTK